MEVKYFLVDRYPWNYIMAVEGESYTICKRRNLEGTHNCSKYWSAPDLFDVVLKVNGKQKAVRDVAMFPNFPTVSTLKNACHPFKFVRELSYEETFVEIL